jgi:anthranilate/para-aminobenzoate synthase component I
MATSIIIRTFVADGRRLSLNVGGGITWRSDPAAEWAETVAKAHGPLDAICGAEVPAPVPAAAGDQPMSVAPAGVAD